MEIVPAILEKNYSHIKENIDKVIGLTKLIQIDICDGVYVRNTTWPYGKSDTHFEAILKEEEGFYGWEKLDFEFDLMVKNPDVEYVRKWVMVGGSKIVLHSDSSSDLSECLVSLGGLVERGLAVSPKTSINTIDKYIESIEYIQIMGIDNVGFQGQSLNQEVFHKIKEIKDKYPKIIVQIDGGVSLVNANLLHQSGADRLVIGSALFDSQNIVDTFNKFKQL